MESKPPLIMDNIHSTTLQKNQTWDFGIFWSVWLYDIPMILVIHAAKLSVPPLPTYLSATTILATTGYGCFMKLSSTSRHELTF
jgi:hypothetical protein